MDTIVFIEAGLVGFIIFVIWMTYHIVSYYKRNQANKELWATVFEGMTNKLVDLSPLKLPDTYIEKKTQNNGQDKDGKNSENKISKNSSVSQ